MQTIEKHAVLDRAKEAVADHDLNYGKPEDNFERIARRWNAHLVNRYKTILQLDAVDVAIMCADLKLARLENDAGHLDSWVDVAGYAACGANIVCVDPTPPRPAPKGWQPPVPRRHGGLPLDAPDPQP